MLQKDICEIEDGRNYGDCLPVSLPTVLATMLQPIRLIRPSMPQL